MKAIGVVGGAGFIGSYITKKFLKEGYRVKVSVTDIKRSEKYEHLFKFKNSENINIQRLKLEDRKALNHFIEDCEIMVHSGTPFRLNVRDAKTELLDPTIKGTTNFLEAVSEVSHVKKVLFLASVAAWNTNFPLPAAGKSAEDIFDEQELRFSSPESHPYCQAKFIANQVVETFIKKNKDLPFEIVSVSPVMVMGKSLSTRESTSKGVQFLIKNKIAPDELFQSFYDKNLAFAVVDVEDVAKAVYKAATTKGLHGKDYLLTSESYKVSDIHEMLNKREPKENAQIIYKNNLAKTDLGVQFRPVKETLNNYQNS
ncbi:NAD-dependent epimerase/dehydratase family protein [Christiangramia sp.]|uniref:NAD-dependent epimerase/dehydratase family protein n=1 Tax=Christiangramia sp. TaxID=1931228 RepID=UPI00261A4E7A|nr:NAD-dependent epimerase/dehydratase family protein [Christiangramia sp.]